MAQKLFISYARKDARELAVRLQNDLQAKGFEVWIDTNEIDGGASWSKAIEDAIESCTTALALLSAGSYVSEICRAEQLRCLRKGKQVIPVLVQANAERPLHLEHINYRDFTNSTDYEISFEQLLSDIREAKTSPSNRKIKETYTNAPALPLNFVERPEERDKLRQELIADDGERRIALTALQGMGGIGKSALAAWICRDEIVQAAFPDGVIWVDVGRENVNLLELIKLVGRKLGDSMEHYSSEVAALSRLRETLQGKSALVVLDDVWHSEHAKAFSDIEASRSRVLFTTRDSSIGESLRASKVQLGVMKPQQALNLLREWAERELPEMPSIADKLGYLPLALKIAGGRLKEMDGQEWLETFQAVSSLKGSRRDTSPTGNLQVCFDLSVQRLANEDQLLYHGLGIFPEDLWIPETVAFKLWQAYNPSLKTVDCRDIARDLHKLALVERRETDGAMLLHDILHDYNREHLKEDAEYQKAHQKLLNYYNPDEKHSWWELESDGYIYENLAYHLIELERLTDLHELLTASPDWMEAKYLHCMGDSAYVADLALAMKHYKDPLSAEDLVKWVELNTVRQVVNARVGSVSKDLLSALLYLGHDKEALNHARLRTNPKEQFDVLCTIWNIAIENGLYLDLKFEEILDVAATIVDTNEQGEALSKLAVILSQTGNFEAAQTVIQSIINDNAKFSALNSLAISMAQIRDARATEVFEQAQEIAQNIADITERSFALSDLAMSFAQIGNFEQARAVTESITNAHAQANALGFLAVSLAQAGDARAAETFMQAHKVALNITDDDSQDYALTDLVNNLVHTGSFEQAHTVAISINDMSIQADALRKLAMSFAQIGNFKQARAVIDSITDAHAHAGALSFLAASLAQAGDAQATEVFMQAQKMALSIDDSHVRDYALTDLVINLTKAKNFEQAQEFALSIHSPREQAIALRDLIISFTEAGDFERAQEVALSIHSPREQAFALNDLVFAFAQVGNFEQAREVAVSIADIDAQADALSGLAASLAQAGDSRAIEVFRLAREVGSGITSAREYVSALSVLAASLAQAGDSRAIEVFRLARETGNSITSDYVKSEALSILAVKLAKAGYYAQAREVAQTISYDYPRVLALKDLAISLMQTGDFEQALEVAQSIPKAEVQADALRDLVISYAQAGDFQQALEIAQNIQDVYGQALALSALAGKLVQTKDSRASEVFMQALKVAQSIQDVYGQALALSALAGKLVQAKDGRASEVFIQALKVAQSIQDADYQADALISLAANLAQNGQSQATEVFKQAQEIAFNIVDAKTQTYVLRDLATSLMQTGNIKQAWQIALRISSTHVQAAVLSSLTNRLAYAEEYDQAWQVAQSIPDRFYKADVLSSLTDRISRTGNFDQARQVALGITRDSNQSFALRSLAFSIAQAGLYQQSLEVFGIQTIEETLELLSSWQNSIKKYYPENQVLWQNLLLEALKIICWQRKDYEPVKAILQN